MSRKKQSPSLCKFVSLYEELHEGFLSASGVDNYFYHDMNISQSQHPTVRNSRSSNKKFFPFKLIQFCVLKTQQRSNLQDQVNVYEKELSFSVVSLRGFLRSFDKARGVYRFQYWNPKLNLDPQSEKRTSLFITVKVSLNIQLAIFVYRSGLETTIFSTFPSKKLNYTLISSYLQTLSTLTIAKLTTSTGICLMLQTTVS